MFGDLTDGELKRLLQGCRAIERDARLLCQDVDRTEQPRPGLAGHPGEALRQLLSPLEELARDLVQSAGGSASQAVAAPAEGEEAAALDRYAIPRDSARSLVTAEIGSTWFGHLMRWERRHNEVVDGLIAGLSAIGGAHALAEIGVAEVTPLLATSAARERLLGRFEPVAADLVAEMRRGTHRTHGLIHLLKETRTLGATALFIRRLTDAVRPSLERLSERVTWIAYSEGYRLAAIEGTHALLQAADALPKGGLALSTATVAPEVLRTLPRYAWAGPQDRETCGACMAQRGTVVYAFSVEEMPMCQEVCGLGDACRHFWSFVPAEG